MSREIKFDLIYQNAMGYEHHLVSLDDFLYGEFADESTPDNVMIAARQYTGLKDKNGVEIYEGDIVKWDDSSDGRYWRVAVVELLPDIQFRCFNCPVIENSSAHGHVFRFGRFIYTDTHNHLHVIGNIYQNPELLGDNQ